MIPSKAPQTVRRNPTRSVKNSSASLLPSNPAAPGSTSGGARGSQIQRLQSRDSQDATLILTSDQDQLDGLDHETLSSGSFVSDGESCLSSNDKEADDGDETSSVSEGSETSDDVVEETESLPAKRRRVDLSPGPKPESENSRSQFNTAASLPADRWTYKVGIEGTLPPISKIDEMFFDMTTKAWKYLGLQPAVQDLVQRKLRIATMCSGTESPLLALQMINIGKRCPNPSDTRY